MKKLIALIIILLAVGVAHSDTLYKGKIGDPDVHWWNGDADDTTFNRRTSTGRLTAIPDVGASTDYDIHMRMGDVITRGPWVDVRAYGAKGDGTTDDSDAVQSAATYAAANSGTLYFPAGTYNGAYGNITIDGDNVTIVGMGATLYNMEMTLSAGYENIGVHGLRWQNNGSSSATFPTCLDVYAQHVNITDVRFFVDSGAAYTAPHLFVILRGDSGYVNMSNIELLGSGGIAVVCSHVNISNFIIEQGPSTSGGDDGIVLIAAAAAMQDIHISNGAIAFANNAVAMGAETEYDIEDVTITNLSVTKGNKLLYIKPGDIGSYFGGVIRNVTVSNCTFDDSEATKAITWYGVIWVSISQNHGLENLLIDNVSIVARNNENRSAQFIQITCDDDDDVGGNTPAASYIENVRITNCSLRDKYEGVANGVGGAPGYPLTYGIRVRAQNTASVSQIYIANTFIDGVAERGISLTDLADSPIISDVTMDNMAIAGVAVSNGALIWDECVPIISGLRVISTDSYVVQPVGADPTQEIIGEGTVAVAFGEYAAGTDAAKAIWVAPCDCWIYMIYMIPNANITQNDTNYSVYTITNETTTNDIRQVRTAITGSGNTDFQGFEANKVTTGNVMISSSYADTLVSRGDVISLTKSDAAAGQASNEMTIVFHYIPY